MGDYMGPVRPIFKLESEPPKNKHCERLIAGGQSSGMFIDITKDGLEINAYYSADSRDIKYAILRESVVIPWKELDKMKVRAENPKKRKKKLGELDRVERKLDLEYLESLPIVTINNRKYYIDPIKRERRSVDVPQEVWRF